MPLQQCLLVFLAGLSSVAATEDARVKVAQCKNTPSSVSDWKIVAPKKTKPNTPRFNISLESPTLQPVGQLRWSANGSLGLPRHPLGIFKFNSSGPACGAQAAYIYEGVLGQLKLGFPACGVEAQTEHEKAGGLVVHGHVDVWTQIPTLPGIDLSTGFALELRLEDGSSEGTGAPLLCLSIEISEPHRSGASKEEDVCQMDMGHPPEYPPDASQQLPSVVVDLDAPPEERWTHVVQPRAQGIKELIDAYLEHLEGSHVNGTILRAILKAVANKEMGRFPAEYRREIEGIATATSLDVGYIWVLNMMYEVIGYCTSLVAQDAAGRVWHGRNLDFGIFMGADPATHSWSLTQKLRAIQFNAMFTRGGKPLYNSTTYGGFVGLISGSKAGAFSITVDTRYDKSVDAGLIGWLRGKHDGCHFLTFETRAVMEANATYAQALHALTTYKPLGPAYIIVAGVQAGEGAVVTKQFNESAESAGVPWNPTADVWDLQGELSNGSFYVLQTNYDRWKPPPEFDDRRYPGMNCLEAIGKDKIDAGAIWGVLSSNPTRNALTTFSTVMSPASGHFEAYMQNCAPGPDCVPF